jgi:hypothetical protein
VFSVKKLASRFMDECDSRQETEEILWLMVDAILITDPKVVAKMLGAQSRTLRDSAAELLMSLGGDEKINSRQN